MSISSSYICFDTFSKLSKSERFEAIELLVKILDLSEVESLVGLLDSHLAKPTAQTKTEIVNDYCDPLKLSNSDFREMNKDVVDVHESNDKRIRLRSMSYSIESEECLARKNGDNEEKNKLNRSARIKGKPIAKSDEKKLFSCGNCGESFSSVKSHKMHIEQFKCNDVCKQIYVQDESKLAKAHSCPKCFKTFSRADYLKAHSVVHTGQKPFSCKKCDKTFSSSGSRYNHIKRFHNTNKHFVCDICDKSWAIKIDLVLHRRIHTSEKPYTCPVCQKKFSRSSTLFLHKKIHTQQGFKSVKQVESTYTDQKPIPCSVCQKLFCFPELHQKIDTRQKSSKLHRKIDTRQKSSELRLHSCENCGKAFKQKKSLKRHNMLHTGEKPHSCELCGKAYIRKSHLKRHMKTAHIEEK